MPVPFDGSALFDILLFDSNRPWTGMCFLRLATPALAICIQKDAVGTKKSIVNVLAKCAACCNIPGLEQLEMCWTKPCLMAPVKSAILNDLSKWTLENCTAKRGEGVPIKKLSYIGAKLSFQRNEPWHIRQCCWLCRATNSRTHAVPQLQLSYRLCLHKGIHGEGL